MKTTTMKPGDKTPMSKDQPKAKEPKQTEQGVKAEGIPDFAANAGEGLTGHKAGDYKIPFVTIVQSLSPQCVESNPKYDENVKPGMVVNTVTGELIDARVSKEGSLLLVPIDRQTEYIQWKPRTSGGGIVHVHKDESILRQTKKGTGDNANKDFMENGDLIATTSKWFVMLMKEDGYFPAIIAMTGSNLKHSRTWLTKIGSERMKKPDGTIFVPPMYSRHWLLSTGPEVKNGNTYFAWVAQERGELVKSKDVYLELQGLRQAVISNQLALPDADATQAALESPSNY
jgi:hypothetical protein